MTAALAPGFRDPVLSAQSVFRSVMDALARPATLCDLPQTLSPPPPLTSAAAALALTLFDQDTPVWLDDPLAPTDVAYWLRFHAGAPIVADPQQAAFAILADPANMPPFDAFPLGTPEYPDRSATLILQVESLERGQELAFCGPGIEDRRILRATPLPADFPRRLAHNRALFPRGVDLLLVTDARVAALPRSIKLIDEV